VFLEGVPRHYLAVLLPVYRAGIMRGVKRVDRGLLRRRAAPYERARSGDPDWFGRTGGLIPRVPGVGRVHDRPVAVPKADRRAWVVLGRRGRWLAGSLHAEGCDNSSAGFR
jgi:hypothetical protein